MLCSQQDEESTPTVDPGSDGTIAAKDEVKITSKPIDQNRLNDKKNRRNKNKLLAKSEGTIQCQKNKGITPVEEAPIQLPPTSVIVTIGRTQISCPVDKKQESTIVHARVFNEYMQELKKKGSKNIEYEEYRKYDRRKQRNMIEIRELYGKLTEVHGPFPIDITIDGLEVKTTAYIAMDDEFGKQFVIGRDTWDLTVINEIRSSKDRSVDLLGNSKSKISFGEIDLIALIDTGAGPSVMSTEAYEGLGKKIEELGLAGHTLSAANNTELKVRGLTPLLKFKLGTTEFNMKFTVVDNVSGTVILGRDFLTMYDVLVDIVNKRLVVRNHDQDYTITEQSMINGGSTYVGQASSVCKITATSMQKIEFTIGRRRGTPDLKGDANRWLAYIEPKATHKLEGKGVRLSRGIAVVENNKVVVSALNLFHEEVEIRPQDTLIKVTPVTSTYSRTVVELDSREVNKVQQQEKRPEVDLIELKEQRLDDESVITGMSLVTGDETISSRSNFPLEREVTGKDLPKKEFLTRPKIDHLEENMNVKQWKQLNEVLEKHEGIFSKSPSDIGCTDLIEHDIELEVGARPFKEPIRRLGEDRKKIVDDQIRILRDTGVIRECKSPYASAIVLVRKQDNSMRFCIDFRKLNDITVKDAFPLPMISEHLDRLGAAKYFTSLDMGNAFWQVRLTEESMAKTAFTTPDHLWEWTRMPFGLCNATATFQRLMTRTIGHLTSKYGNLVLCYVDDILIATSTIEEHLERLDEVFMCLARAGLKLKAAKCKLMERQVKFLGRIISERGVEADPGQVQKILNWRVPSCKQELESFIGLANYYREFIQGFANIVAPLNKLKGKNTPYVWNEATQTAFDGLKQSLTTEPILGIADGVGEFVLDTDASAVAIAGILHQRQIIRGQEKLVVICYGSRGLRGSERNYGAAKNEMLAALTFIEHYRKFLYGKKFIIRCDNMAFSWLKSYSTKSEHVARWITRLDGFDFTIEHRDRNKHTNADGLSKKTEYYQRRANHIQAEHVPGFAFMNQNEFEQLPLLTNDKLNWKQDDPRWLEKNWDLKDFEEKELAKPNMNGSKPFPAQQETENDSCKLCSLSINEDEAIEIDVNVIQAKGKYDQHELAKAQERDVGVRAFRNLTRGGEPEVWLAELTTEEKNWYQVAKKDLKINHDDVLVRKLKYQDGIAMGYTIVLPAEYRFEVMNAAHDGAGHFGNKKTLDQLVMKFNWPGMRRDLEQYVQSCPACQKGKPNAKSKPHALKPIISERPNQLVQIDFLKLNESSEGHKGLLVIIDHFSKYAQAVAVTDFTAKIAAEAVGTKWISLFGVPETIQSDQGSHFEAELFQEFTAVFGIQKTHSSPYHPQSNGLVERQNRTLIQMLRIVCHVDQHEWHKFLPHVTMAYNFAVHSSTKLTPFKLFTGREVTSPIWFLFPNWNLKKYENLQEYTREMVGDWEKCILFARENIRKAQVRQERNHNRKIAQHDRVEIGEQALVFVDVVPRKGVPKLTRKWRGPFRCVDIWDNGRNYKFENGMIAHAERVIPYENRPSEMFVNGEDGEFVVLTNQRGALILFDPLLDNEDEIFTPPTPRPNTGIGIGRAANRRRRRANRSSSTSGSSSDDSSSTSSDEASSAPVDRGYVRDGQKHELRPRTALKSTKNENFITKERQIQRALRKSERRSKHVVAKFSIRKERRPSGNSIDRSRVSSSDGVNSDENSLHTRKEPESLMGDQDAIVEPTDEESFVALYASANESPRSTAGSFEDDTKIPSSFLPYDDENSDEWIENESAWEMKLSGSDTDDAESSGETKDPVQGRGAEGAHPSDTNTESQETPSLSDLSEYTQVRHLDVLQGLIDEKSSMSETLLPGDYARGLARNFSGGESTGTFVSTTGLSRKSFLLQANWKDGIPPEGQESAECNERCNIELEPTGNLIEPPLIFGKDKKHFPIDMSPPADTEVSETLKTTSSEERRRIEASTSEGTTYTTTTSYDSLPRTESPLSEEDIEYLMTILGDNRVKVLREDLIDREDNIMIDIPANQHLGGGLRRHVSRLHVDYDPLDNHFSKGLTKGDLIIIEKPEEEGSFNHTIFYLVCRLRLEDDFDVDAYRTALKKLRDATDERKISSCSTAKVPFRRNEHGCAIRDAMNFAFEGSGMKINLCVGSHSH